MSVIKIWNRDSLQNYKHCDKSVRITELILSLLHYLFVQSCIPVVFLL